jgi:O-antigen/teichoic acid export membrane protein
LFGYLPLLFVTAWYRGFALGFLQAKFAVRDIFFVDASNILGSLGLVYVMTMLGRFHSADDLLQVMILAQAVSTILAMFFTFPLMKSSLRYERTALLEVLNFGKYTFGTNSIYTFLMQADVFFVSSFSGLAAVAVYNAAKLFTRVFDMLSQVQQMFLIPYSSRRWGERDVSGLSVTAEKAICFSTLLLLPVLLLFVVFPAPLLEFLYHGKYPTAAPVLRVFGLLALVTPWNATAVSFIVGIGRVKEVFVISFLYAAITIPLYWLLTPLFGAVGTAVGLVGSFAVITVIYVRITQRIVPFTLTGVAGRVRDAWSFGRNLLQIGTQR